MRSIIVAVVIFLLIVLLGAYAWTQLGLREKITGSQTDTTPLLQSPQATYYPLPTNTTIPLITLPTPVGNSKSTSSPKPTQTPIPTPSTIYACQYLNADPVTGTEPLTVRFTATGVATAGSGRTYTFDFGDDTPQVSQTAAVITHTYAKAGNYNAFLTVRDSSNNPVNLGSTACQRTIIVKIKPQAVTSGKTSTLPKTGPETGLLLMLAPLTGIGIWLYKRFKLL